MSNAIHVTTGGTTVPAELFEPAGAPNGGVVVIAYGSDGMADPWAAMIRDYANELSGQNFSVIIPDYLVATASAPGFAVFGQSSTHARVWQAVLQDTVQFSRMLPGVSGTRVGLLGFSLGGYLCLRIRESSKLLVEFFAPEFPELGGIGPCLTGARNAQIHHGTSDHLVPFENAEHIQAKLTSESTACELFRYEGAGHGFVGLDANNATAQRSARERTLTCFRQNL